MGKEEQGVTQPRYLLIPRVLVFIRRGDDFLLIKGASHKRLWANQYNGIGGHLERGEDLLSAAKRAAGGPQVVWGYHGRCRTEGRCGDHHFYRGIYPGGTGCFTGRQPGVDRSCPVGKSASGGGRETPDRPDLPDVTRRCTFHRQFAL